MSAYRHDINGDGFRVGYAISINVDITSGPESGFDMGKPRAVYSEIDDFEAELHFDVFRAYGHAIDEVRQRYEQYMADKRELDKHNAKSA